MTTETEGLFKNTFFYEVRAWNTAIFYIPGCYYEFLAGKHNTGIKPKTSWSAVADANRETNEAGG